MMLFENKICNFRDKIEFWVWRTNFASSFLFNSFDLHSENNFLKNCSSFLYTDSFNKISVFVEKSIEKSIKLSINEWATISDSNLFESMTKFSFQKEKLLNSRIAFSRTSKRFFDVMRSCNYYHCCTL